MIVLYHGSESQITSPSLEKGKSNNDYGRGFYMTDSYDLAGEWACKNGEDGFINEYGLDETDLKILDLSKGYSILHWLALLLNNRSFFISKGISSDAKKYILENYLLNLKDYDVVIGFRADDSYFSFAQSFINNSISLRQLEKAMKLGNLGLQTVLISEKAFSHLRFIKAHEAKKNMYYQSFFNRDFKARSDFRKIKGDGISKRDVFMIDLLRKKDE